jgi:hypothetical protein
MREIRSATEDEMILAFLRAEISSPRHAEMLMSWFGECGGNRAMIEAGDPTDASENAVRRCILHNFRGYRNVQPLLFPNFPGFVIWKLVALSAEDIGNLKYAAWPTWEQLSGGTRLVADGAANLDTVEIENLNVHVREIVEHIDTGTRKVADYEPVIIVATEMGAQHVVVEGHSRLTAYCSRLKAVDEVMAFAGYSANMNNWDLMKL